MNILDSELVENQFRSSGHRFVDNAKDANVVLLNTCSVRDLSEQKVLSRLGIVKERKDKGEKVIVGVLGCMAERAHDQLAKKRPFIDVMVGPSKINDTKDLVEAAFNSVEKQSTQKSLSYFVKRKGVSEAASMSPFDSLEALDAGRAPNKNLGSQAYVRITRGCNKFCSFCVVPRTRGPELHRPPESIIDEVKRLVDSGVKEVTLLGQTINHYFYEGTNKWSFADLLFQVHEQVPNLARLRFLTSYPRDFSDEALDVMKNCERICRYLHIPAQSGSDKVLRDMNRGYDLETYMSLIERAKARMPDISLLGDMIVGFPTENDEDFEASLELLRKVRFKNLFIFKYSPRPNTVAHKRFSDNISDKVKKSRHTLMLNLQNEIALEHHQAMLGQTHSVLCESEAKLDPFYNKDLVQLRSKSEPLRLIGRTRGDHIVHFSGAQSLIGKLVDVKIESARSLSLGGSLVSP
ncbi:MAG: tRNA (N6-isopentenyl adenosine(37)-C2)-methylthiotransferase MiaB [Myxococcales bacterium]|nr:tRNA (N6-isopentenyl adenosine(37)-C2)-methylthiotransferase MiaB [Myxococcales bacterium]USN50432.1 MAG: tRNA (N6-isopentenyl adenosine(37)-C2)-methylthiotransferase MiaB [Myxococcales bacterium]